MPILSTYVNFGWTLPLNITFRVGYHQGNSKQGCNLDKYYTTHSFYFQDDFHVDQFVVQCRRRVALETLQEDLNIYLKTLQSAMIELINKDYADFVNLSTNLVSYTTCPHALLSSAA